MRVRGLLSLILLLMLLAGCRTGAVDFIPPTDDFGANSVITWDRSPDSILFRAEIVGGGRENEFAARNDIAPCTIYGDNRIVWTNEIGPFNEQVLFDQVTDDAITLFVEYLTVVDQLFNYPARADLQLPSETVPVYEQIEVNIGATTESNFFVGFSGEIAEGGVFSATYNILPKGAKVRMLVTLPGGFEKEVNGYVRFVCDPMDMASESEPGMGVQFESLDAEARELILRFIRKRPPMFYDE